MSTRELKCWGDGLESHPEIFESGNTLETLLIQSRYLLENIDRLVLLMSQTVQQNYRNRVEMMPLMVQYSYRMLDL